MRVIALAGQAERLSMTRLPVRLVEVRAQPLNRGPVRIGDASIGPDDPTIEPGQALRLRGDPWLDLSEVYVIVDRGGDAVQAVYIA